MHCRLRRVLTRSWLCRTFGGQNRSAILKRYMRAVWLPRRSLQSVATSKALLHIMSRYRIGSVCILVDGNLGSAVPVLAISDRLAPRIHLQHTGRPISSILLLRAVARPCVRPKLATFFASLQAHISHAVHTVEGAEVYLRHNQLRALSHHMGQYDTTAIAFAHKH